MRQLADQISALVHERTELDARLGENSSWRALLIARAGSARGDKIAHRNVERLEAALASNRLFRAREALDVAIASLIAEQAATTDTAASRPDAMRSRATALIHTQPPIDRVPAAMPAAASGDDLTKIRDIDGALAARLRSLGVTRFSDIAAWSAHDVRHHAALLEIGNRISRHNWIEQAAALATRAGAGAAPPASTESKLTPGATPATHDKLATARPPASADTPPPRAEPFVAAPAVDAPERPDRDQLALISGMTDEMIEWLAAAGVTRFAEIAAWRAGDLACYGAHIGIGEAARRHCWIEQAAVLAAGHATAYAARMLKGETEALVARPADFCANRDPAPVQPQSLAPHEPMISGTAGAHAAATSTVDTPSPEPEAPARPALHVDAPSALATDEAAPPGARRSRLAERIAALGPEAREATETTGAPAARDAGPAAPASLPAAVEPATLGSWSARRPEDEVVHDLDSEMWSQIAEVPLGPTPAADAGWLEIGPGEADVVIQRHDDQPPSGAAPSTRPLARSEATARSPARELPIALRPLTEEATVEIIKHGERLQPTPEAPGAPTTDNTDAAPVPAVARLLKGLTGR